MAIRTASAEWKGDLRGGTGTFESASGYFDGSYSFESRFEENGATNPEELVAAAHASCFSMFLAAVLEEGGNVAESVRTEAKVHILKVGEDFEITKIDLATVARVPGLDDAALQEAAKTSKEDCPISKALAAVAEINVDARLES
jgi:osmotically inducible protein OsmC